MILDKPHMILGYFHERLFSQYGIQLHDQWVKMSEKLKCSENTIRKYRNEIPKSKAEVILNTAVELGLECGMSGGNLKLFYRNFIQSVKQYFGTMIWLRQELIVKINEMPQSDEEKWEKIVCPIPVERKINEFLKNDNKKFLYICGSHKSGIIVSVEKFLWNMDEKKKLPHVYDIRNKSLKDLEQDSKLQDALRTEEVILFCVGYEMFPPEMLEWDYSGKVIIAAHIPYVKKYIPYMEYMVFDDAVNQYNCIEAIVQGYIPEVLNEIKQRENGLVQKFINKIGRITGGIPLAIRILGEAIQEKNVFALADNLEEILEEDFYLKKTLKPTYEQMWTEFLSYVWTQISEETKNAIVIASYFKGDISLELFHFLVGKNAASEKWRNILEECYHYMLLMESGKSNEEENGGVQGVRMFCLTRELIRFKYWDEWEYGQVMTLSAEFYAQKVRDLDCNKTYRGEKTFLIAVVKLL